MIIVKNDLFNLANSPNFFHSTPQMLTFRFRIVIFIFRETENVSGNDSGNALRRISVCLGELWRSDDQGYCEGLRREREPVSYTHLDVYKRQATSAAGTGGTDIPLFLGIVLFTSIFIFAGNLIANILYQVVDPQTREGVKN